MGGLRAACTSTGGDSSSPACFHTTCLALPRLLGRHWGRLLAHCMLLLRWRVPLPLPRMNEQEERRNPEQKRRAGKEEGEKCCVLCKVCKARRRQAAPLNRGLNATLRLG